MSIKSLGPLPKRPLAYVRDDNQASDVFFQYMNTADAILRALNNYQIGTGLTNAANDAAAAAAGVAVGTIYRNGSILMVRVS